MNTTFDLKDDDDIYIIFPKYVHIGDAVLLFISYVGQI